MLLGCIGDDFTGSSDLANTLSKQGMKTVQYCGVPSESADERIEAGVVALKSRSMDIDEAVRQSLDALNWLRSQGARQFFFKYCSTFDSTPKGNIGPVLDALSDALQAHRVIVCPAFPATGRTVYQGHLFVKDALLNESGMQHHPLTPMTDADIRRWLSLQTKHNVGHVPALDVFSGHEAVVAAMDTEHESGNRFIVVDAIRDQDLMTIGRAAAGLPLVSGGSGVALGLPENFKRSGQLLGGSNQWGGESGRCVALCGSCSTATQAQVKAHSELHAVYQIHPQAVLSKQETPEQVCDWLLKQSGTPLVYSSAQAKEVDAVQASFGKEVASAALEHFFAEVAKLLVAAGVTRLIVAGGETSGAVIEALNITSMEIGPEIDPGVPAMRAGSGLVVAMKSGNFGAVDFFTKAAKVLFSEG